MRERVREEVINTKLAEVFRKGFNLKAVPEVRSGSRGIPDVSINYEGIRIIVEGRRSSLLLSLRKTIIERVEENLADIGIAIVYPEDIFYDYESIEQRLLEEKLPIAIAYWGKEGVVMIENDMTLHELVNVIKADIFSALVGNHILKETVKQVEESFKKLVARMNIGSLFVNLDVLIEKVSEVLQVTTTDFGGATEYEEDEGD